MALLTKKTRNGAVDISRLLRSNDFSPASDLHILLKRERARADRTGLPFSQVLLECDNMDIQSTDHLMRTIYNRVRLTDEVKWLNKQNVAIILPDTTSEGAHTLADSILSALNIDSSYLNCKIFTYPSMRFTNEDEFTV